MHELSLAKNLIEKIEQIAFENKATKVTHVILHVGVLSGIEIESLEFCLPEATRNSLAENTIFKIEKVPLLINCSDCFQKTSPDPQQIHCLQCGSTNVQIEKGKEFILFSLDLDC